MASARSAAIWASPADLERGGRACRKSEGGSVADEDRPQYQHGIGTIGGSQFHWGSGMPGKYWSIPYGDYPVTPNAPTGAWAQQAGAIPVANNVIPDPLLGRNRIGIMIHSGSAPDLDTLYTQGCFKVAPQEWPAVRSEILKEASNGPLYLHVAPGGVAAFTNTKTFSQAGDQTPAANANAAGNTTAAAVSGGATPPSRPATTTPGTTLNSPMDLVAQVESGNRNIPQAIHDVNTDRGTPAGGYFQIIDPTWQRYAGAAGVDVNQYPNAMSAPRNIQAQVASAIPVNQWGPNTVAALKAQYPNIDTSQTLGAVQTAALGGAPATPATPAPAAATPGVLPGFPGKAQSDAFTQGATALDKAIHGDQSAGQQEGAGQAAAFNFPQARNVHPLFGLSSQIYGNTLNSLATPLQWGSATPGQNPYAASGGAPIGQQFGTQLTSIDQMRQMMAMMGSPYASPTGT